MAVIIPKGKPGSRPPLDCLLGLVSNSVLLLPVKGVEL